MFGTISNHGRHLALEVWVGRAKLLDQPREGAPLEGVSNDFVIQADHRIHDRFQEIEVVFENLLIPELHNVPWPKHH